MGRTDLAYCLAAGLVVTRVAGFHDGGLRFQHRRPERPTFLALGAARSARASVGYPVVRLHATAEEEEEGDGEEDFDDDELDDDEDGGDSEVDADIFDDSDDDSWGEETHAVDTFGGGQTSGGVLSDDEDGGHAASPKAMGAINPSFGVSSIDPS